MKLSENANYQMYMQSFGRDDLDAAIQHLKACLDDIGKGAEEAGHRAFVLQEIGNLFLLQSNRAEADRFHQDALRADPTSLLTKLQFAKFLAKAGDREDAIRQCDEIINSARSAPHEASEDDFGSDHYIRLASELKEQCIHTRV